MADSPGGSRNSDIMAWASALGEVETGNNPQAWGDFINKPATTHIAYDFPDAIHRLGSPRAMGRWQVHPEWYQEWAGPVSAGDTWDDTVLKALARFYVHYITTSNLSPVEIAMVFHLGAHAVLSEHEWDTPYADRFVAAYVLSTWAVIS